MNLDELRSVYARAADGSIFFLPEGGSTETVKDAAKNGKLRCIDPLCEYPTLSAHGGDKKRHHFQHTETVDHVTNAETLLHIIARQVLADWTKAQHPDWTITQEGEFADRRLALVLDSPVKTIAVDLQRSDDEEHSPEPDLDAWIWIDQLTGHLGGADTGTPVFWLDPLERTLAVAVTDYEGLECAPHLVPGRYLGTYLGADPLDTCTIDADGLITTPTSLRLRANEAEVNAREQVREQQRQAAEQARAEREKALDAARERRAAEQAAAIKAANQAAAEAAARRAELQKSLARPGGHFMATVGQPVHPPAPGQTYTAEQIQAALELCADALSTTFGPEQDSYRRVQTKWRAMIST